jgi:hypothetical protein
MDPVLIKGYTGPQQHAINLVRTYLQATTLSDISNGEGTNIDDQALHGKRHTNKQYSSSTWP